jgi:hypothetical protein
MRRHRAHERTCRWTKPWWYPHSTDMCRVPRVVARDEGVDLDGAVGVSALLAAEEEWR